MEEDTRHWPLVSQAHVCISMCSCTFMYTDVHHNCTNISSSKLTFHLFRDQVISLEVCRVTTSVSFHVLFPRTHKLKSLA